jgi:hypothetical protein
MACQSIIIDQHMWYTHTSVDASKAWVKLQAYNTVHKSKLWCNTNYRWMNFTNLWKSCIMLSIGSWSWSYSLTSHAIRKCNRRHTNICSLHLTGDFSYVFNANWAIPWPCVRSIGAHVVPYDCSKQLSAWNILLIGHSVNARVLPSYFIEPNQPSINCNKSPKYCNCSKQVCIHKHAMYVKNVSRLQGSKAVANTIPVFKWLYSNRCSLIAAANTTSLAQHKEATCTR